MALEIERRFLVKENYTPSDPAAGVPMRACYLLADGGATIRVRLEGDKAVMTLKQRNSAVERTEFEYPVPFEDALHIITHFPKIGEVVEKVRYTEFVNGMEWVVDIFAGANSPLCIAEVELDDAGREIVIPEWAAAEITGDDSYSNAALAMQPYSLRGQ